MKRVNRRFFFIVAILAAVYVAVGIALYTVQDRLIFPRRVNEINAEPLAPYNSNLRTPDGTVLNGVIFPAREDPAPLVIAFGGNAHDVTGMAHFLWQDVLATRATVVGFSYRGYPNVNGYSTGIPTEQNLYQDALFLYDEMVGRYKPSAVYAIGYSLGSAVATHLATQRPVAALTLVTPFTSMVDMAQARYPVYPAGIMVKYVFPVKEMLSDVRVPVHIVVAGQDGLIPPGQPELLRQSVKIPGLYASVPATHGNVLDHPDMPDILRKMIGP
jgi:hypothetical protein